MDVERLLDGLLHDLARVLRVDDAVDLAGDVALAAAGDGAVVEACGGVPGDVGVGAEAIALAGQHDHAMGVVGSAVAAAVEAMRAGGAAGAGEQRGDAAERDVHATRTCSRTGRACGGRHVPFGQFHAAGTAHQRGAPEVPLKGLDLTQQRVRAAHVLAWRRLRTATAP